MFKFVFCCALAVLVSAASVFAAPGSVIVRQDNVLMSVYYSCPDSLGAVAIILQITGGVPSEPQWVDTVHNNGLNVLYVKDDKITIASFSTREGLPPGEHLIATFKVSSPTCTVDTTRNSNGIGSEFGYLDANGFVPDFFFNPSSVGGDPGSSIPSNFELRNPYPNPFNPNTVITFALPVSSYVNLSIYNVRGQKVVVLVNENLQAGTYSFTWNAENKIASGVYFCVLKANNFKQIRKMVLEK
jgi:hypothetical protein